MRSIFVWDAFVRFSHWGIALLFFANYFITEDGEAAHRLLGYALMGLLSLRIVWGFIGPRHARFASFWPTPGKVKAHLKALLYNEEDTHLGHNPLGAVMVFNLLASLAFLGGSGWLAETDMFWGVGWVEELHEFLASYVLASVGLHLLGVLFETKRSKINLVKAMITGIKTLPISQKFSP